MESVERKKFLNFLKNELLTKSYPPTFKSDNEFYNKYHLLFNCYAYAMQYVLDKELLSKYENTSYKNTFAACSPFVFTPGFTKRDDIYIQSKDMLLDYFREDCDVLGINVKESTISSIPAKDSYKIAIYIRRVFDSQVGKQFKGFHFFRQNDDKTWSEKQGYYDGIKLVENIEYDMYECILEQAGIFDISNQLIKRLK